MKKKYVLKISIIVIPIIMIGFIARYFYLVHAIELNKDWQINKPSKSEKLCFDFVNDKMTKDNYGIFTNYLDNNLVKPQANGHEVLSESEGLIMLYSVYLGDKQLFDKHFDIVKKNILLPNNLLRWRYYKTKNRTGNTSASIDDLRIVRALFYANDRWEDKKYRKLLFDINKGIKKYELENNNLLDFYDYDNDKKANYISTCYIDLYTYDLLSRINHKWKKVKENQLNILKKAYISDSLPLYKKSFNYKEHKYSENIDINTIESMLVVLHLSEIKETPYKTIQWIKEQMATKGALYATYNIETGKPSSIYESTAVYAIVAQIASNIGDKELYNLMKNNMVKYQVLDNKSQIYGSFGMADTKTVYSFDNLEALLAFQKGNLIK